MRAAELTILDQIIVRKRAELLNQQTIIGIEELEGISRPPRRPFRSALESKQPAIIAEVKKASPSAGVIAENFDPAAIASSYEQGGAAALSVLTDQQFFQGSLEHLDEARQATRLPVLRKDFTLDRYHLLEAAAAGADAVLLIVAALPNFQLRELLEQAEELDLEALVEVHSEDELYRAIDVGASLIGINNRNLKTLEVSLETSLQLAAKVPPSALWISESGIRTPEDMRRLMDAGCRAFLIGESLMKQANPGVALANLIEGARALAS